MLSRYLVADNSKGFIGWVDTYRDYKKFLIIKADRFGDNNLKETAGFYFCCLASDAILKGFLSEDEVETILNKDSML